MSEFDFFEPRKLKMWVATVALWIGSLGQCFPTTVRQYTSVPCQV